MTLADAKDFILFCKANNVFQAKFDGLEFIISEPPQESPPQPSAYDLLGISSGVTSGN